MIRRKQTQFIRRVLYSLKRGYGFPITFYKVTEEEYNLNTGARNTTIDYHKINKVIVLPAQEQRKFEYDLAYIAAAKNFTYGGFYDTAMRKVIVDTRDLNGFTIDIGNYFIWDAKRWEVAQVMSLEYNTALLINGKMVEGSPRYMIQEFSVESLLQFTQEVS